MYGFRFQHRRPALFALAALIASTLTACDDDPVEPGNPQDISIAVSPASVTMRQGEAPLSW